MEQAGWQKLATVTVAEVVGVPPGSIDGRLRYQMAAASLKTKPRTSAPQREEREVVLDLGAQVRVALELAIEIPAQVGATGRILRPKWQVVARAAGRAHDEVVAAKEANSVLVGGAGLPVVEVAASLPQRLPPTSN
jgi:hypothetical protein